MLDFRNRRVLVVVKTYPNPSRKYTETVCVAGIDLRTHEWLRLYPIPFRMLTDNRKFKKYSVIDVQVTRSSGDPRPESYHVNADSIAVREVWDTKTDRTWSRRRNLVLAQGATSLCALKLKQRSDRASLGIVKPLNVEFCVERAELPRADLRKSYYAQIPLLGEPLPPIEPIPFRFGYRFNCDGEAECPGHNLSVVDWELMQAYRSWRFKYRDEKVLLDKIRQKWQDDMFAPGRDSFLYAGNVFLHQQSFLVLGVFWPPRQ